MTFNIGNQNAANINNVGRDQNITGGQTGIVVRHNADSGRGLLKFPAPIMGSEEWDFICEGKLASGDRVTVTELSGNAVIVRRQG